MTITKIPFQLNQFDQRPQRYVVFRAGQGLEAAVYICTADDETGTDLLQNWEPKFQKAAMKALVEHEFVVELPPQPKDDRIFKDHHDLPRLHLERRIIWNMMKFLAAHGWQVSSVYDGEETVKDKNPVDAMETVFSVDECRIRFRSTGYLSLKNRSVAIILGNGEDVISDHSVSDDDNFADLMDQFPIDKVRDAVTVYAAPSPEVLDMLEGVVRECWFRDEGARFPSTESLDKAEAFLKQHGRSLE